MDVSQVIRFGIFHMCIESVLLIIIFVVASLNIVFGGLVFLASFLSLIGASIALCCCPNPVGWTWNVILHSIAFIVRLLTFIFILIVIGMSPNQNIAAYVTFIVCITISTASGLPFWVMSRRALRSFQITPEGGGFLSYALANPLDGSYTTTFAVQSGNAVPISTTATVAYPTLATVDEGGGGSVRGRGMRGSSSGGGVTASIYIDETMVQAVPESERGMLVHDCDTIIAYAEGPFRVLEVASQQHMPRAVELVTR